MTPNVHGWRKRNFVANYARHAFVRILVNLSNDMFSRVVVVLQIGVNAGHQLLEARYRRVVHLTADLVPQRAWENTSDLTSIFVLSTVSWYASDYPPDVPTSASNASKNERLPWPVIWFVNCFCAKSVTVVGIVPWVCAAHLAVEIQPGAC